MTGTPARSAIVVVASGANANTEALLQVLDELRRARTTSTLVLTNSVELAALAGAAGARVVACPWSDVAPIGLELLRAVAALLQHDAEPPDVFALVHSGALRVSAAHIDGILALVTNTDAPWAFGGVRAGSLWIEQAGQAQRVPTTEPLHYADGGLLYAASLVRLTTASPEEAALYAFEREHSQQARSSSAPRASSLDSALPAAPAALVMDFDGVFTDNRVLVLEDGTEGVWCHRGDGLGLDVLRQRGFPLLVISKEQNRVVAARCRKLRLDCLHGIDDKWPLLRGWLDERQIATQGVVYIGNDVNDLDCLRGVGCGVAPRDAHPLALHAARWVLAHDGGAGALRELCAALAHKLGFSLA